jgi:hypothetical protein
MLFEMYKRNKHTKIGSSMLKTPKVELVVHEKAVELKFSPCGVQWPWAGKFLCTRGRAWDLPQDLCATGGGF